MSDYPNTLNGWRRYLADSLHSLTTIGSSLAQQEFAKYETGGRILEMQEHMEAEDWITLLVERGITPTMQADYKRRFLAEVTSYVNKSAF